MSGLSTARLLLDRGHRVTLVSGDPPRQTTSHLAAAVWFPTASGPADAVARWSAAAYGVLVGEASDGVPGVYLRESLVLYRDEAAVRPPLPSWAEAVGEVRLAREDELPPGYPYGLRFVVPMVEMPTYLPYLYEAVVRGGAQHVLRRLAALDQVLELGPDVVINAAGLAAGELVGDDSTFPVRGQIVRVVNPGLSLSVRDEHHPGGRAYVHPRLQDCIFGGTLAVGEWDTTPNAQETAAIVARCADIVPALAGAQVIESIVGLRPDGRFDSTWTGPCYRFQSSTITDTAARASRLVGAAEPMLRHWWISWPALRTRGAGAQRSGYASRSVRRPAATIGGAGRGPCR